MHHRNGLNAPQGSTYLILKPLMESKKEMPHQSELNAPQGSIYSILNAPMESIKCPIGVN